MTSRTCALTAKAKFPAIQIKAIGPLQSIDLLVYIKKNLKEVAAPKALVNELDDSQGRKNLYRNS